MIVCKKCGKENSEENKFCLNCGNRLDGKIKCPGCQELVDDGGKFCPHCATRLTSDPVIEQEVERREVVRQVKIVDPEKKKKTRNLVYSIISNSIVILFCLVLSLIMLFGSVSTLTQEVGLKEKSFSNDLFDYAGASFKAFGEFTIDDFGEIAEEIIDEHTGDEDFNEEDLMNEMNLLNLVMVDDFDDYSLLTRIFIIITFLLAIAMLVMPLVLLGFAIYDLVKYKRTNFHKKFLLMNLLLGLIAIVTIKLSELSLGAGLVFYIILTSLCLVFSYVIDILSKDRKFKPVKFSLRLITSFVLFILVFISFGSVANFTQDDFETKKEIETITIGEIAGYVSYIGETDDEPEGSYFSEIMVGTEMEEANLWVVYFSLIIPLFTVASGAFIICGLLFETKRNIGLSAKPTHTALYLWLSLVFKVLQIAAVIVMTFVFNDFTKEILEKSDIKIRLSASLIVGVVFILALAIYQTVTNKIQQSEE